MATLRKLGIRLSRPHVSHVGNQGGSEHPPGHSTGVVELSRIHCQLDKERPLPNPLHVELGDDDHLTTGAEAAAVEEEVMTDTPAGEDDGKRPSMPTGHDGGSTSGNRQMGCDNRIRHLQPRLGGCVPRHLGP